MSDLRKTDFDEAEASKNSAFPTGKVGKRVGIKK